MKKIRQRYLSMMCICLASASTFLAAPPSYSQEWKSRFSEIVPCKAKINYNPTSGNMFNWWAAIDISVTNRSKSEQKVQVTALDKDGVALGSAQALGTGKDLELKPQESGIATIVSGTRRMPNSGLTPDTIQAIAAQVKSEFEAVYCGVSYIK